MKDNGTSPLALPQPAVRCACSSLVAGARPRPVAVPPRPAWVCPRAEGEGRGRWKYPRFCGAGGEEGVHLRANRGPARLPSSGTPAPSPGGTRGAGGPLRPRGAAVIRPRCPLPPPHTRGKKRHLPGVGRRGAGPRPRRAGPEEPGCDAWSVQLRSGSLPLCLRLCLCLSLSLPLSLCLALPPLLLVSSQSGE